MSLLQAKRCSYATPLEKNFKYVVILGALVCLVFFISSCFAQGWLPTSDLGLKGQGKFTDAFKQMIGSGGSLAMLVVLIVAFLVFAVAIVNAFWKMRKGDFELTDLGTIVITGALCAILVVYALNEVDNVIQTGTGVHTAAVQ